MEPRDPVWNTPRAHDLIHAKDIGGVIRYARRARGWRQADLGRVAGYSASTISRLETGRRPATDLDQLRRVARAVELPPSLLTILIADDAQTRVGATTTTMRQVVVGEPRVREDEPVRRREFLQFTGLASIATATLSAVVDVDPAQVLTSRLGDALLGSAVEADPVPVRVLRENLVAAQRDFTACQYLTLANRLPAVLATTEATATVRPSPGAHQVLADAYALSTRALIKVAASGLEWVAADRSLRAARDAEDPLVLAEAQRLVASVLRRAGHHDRALTLTLDAANHLSFTTEHPDHLVMGAALFCSAGYAAARAGDRDRANELLTDAHTIATRLAGHDQYQATRANLVSHKVSVADILGDAGTALAAAHSIPVAAIPTTERRARLLVDSAMAYHHWNKPDQAYQTLLAAERTAPGEVRTRNAVRRLVTDLLNSPRQAAMPGLPALATRVNVPY